MKTKQKQKQNREIKDISWNEYNKWSNLFYQKTFLHFAIIASVVGLVLGLG